MKKKKTYQGGEKMHAAFILIVTKQGEAFSVAEDISELDNIEISYPVTGPYDVITYVKTEKELTDRLKSIVKEIHSMDGVLNTLTSVAVH